MPKIRADHFDGYWCTDDDSHQECLGEGVLSAGPDIVESIKAVRAVFGGQCRLEYLGYPRIEVESAPPDFVTAEEAPKEEAKPETKVAQAGLFGGEEDVQRSKQGNRGRVPRKRS